MATADLSNGLKQLPAGRRASIILSFDVEEHDRIEAAAHLQVDPQLKEHYAGRVEPSTRFLMDQLAERDIKATFFFVGQTALRNKSLVRDLHAAGHEIASHGWDHQRLHRLTPPQYAVDVRQSKDALEDITGEAVIGYRAPTFSVVEETAWAIDVLSECGYHYDSSIFPVRHDRYGVPNAPRTPFLAQGVNLEIMELPPLILRLMGVNLPVGGGGYFRLLPLFFLESAVNQVEKACQVPVVTLYFHPWEFDVGQPRLPLGTVSKFRTYVGIPKTASRLSWLLKRHEFSRAADVLEVLKSQQRGLSTFKIGTGTRPVDPARS